MWVEKALDTGKTRERDSCQKASSKGQRTNDEKFVQAVGVKTHIIQERYRNQN